MPRVSAQYLADRRADVLRAAARAFARDGFHRATMQDIVREAGASAGAVYRYFDSKEAIVMALAAERHARERTAIAQSSEEAGLARRLEALAVAFFAPLANATEREERRLGIQLWAEALRDDRVRRLVRRGADEPRAAIAAWIVDARDAGEIDPRTDADACARAFVALFHGFVLQQAWDPRVDAAAYLAVLRAAIPRLVGRGEPRDARPGRKKR